MVEKFINKKIIKEQYYLSKDIFPEVNEESLRKVLRIPKQPKVVAPDAPKPKPSPKTSKDRGKILAPLDEVFFDSELMDDLIVHTSVPQLLDREVPIYPGVILYGPPGTGKSEFQRVVCRVYENTGAYSKQVSASAVNSCFVGQFAKNLETELQTASKQAEIRGLPSFLSFDEGSILAEQAKQGATSVSKHYQEAIDTLKRYIGNDCGRELVLAISTNQLPEDFEEAMTREGRLTTFYIGYPSEEQLSRMWNHFLIKYKVLKLTDEQAEELADLTPNTMGAFIEEFARGYIPQRRSSLLLERGYSGMLEALKNGKSPNEKEVKDSINYETLRTDLKNYLQRNKERNKKHRDNEKTEMGFHGCLETRG